MPKVFLRSRAVFMTESVIKRQPFSRVRNILTRSGAHRNLYLSIFEHILRTNKWKKSDVFGTVQIQHPGKYEGIFYYFLLAYSGLKNNLEDDYFI